MQLVQSLGIVFVFLVLPVGVYLQCFTESEFILNPLIDTHLPQGFTQVSFNKIKPGMTKAEVLELIPAPSQNLEESSWQYGNDGAAAWGDYAWFQFLIQFDKNNRVIKTEQMKFHD